MAILSDSPVPVKIMNSPQGGGAWGPGGRSDTLAFLVGEAAGGAPADLYTFLTFVGGAAETTDMGGGVTVERIVPLRHPYLPDLLADSLRWRGIGEQVDGAPGWKNSVVEVEFVQPPFGTGGDAPFYTVRHRGSAEYDTIPNASMAFADGMRTTGDWGVRVAEVAMLVTTYQSPDPVGAAILDLLGKVNSAVFLGAAIGYVKFETFDSDFTQNISGITIHTKTFAITFKERKWNEVMRKDGGLEIPLNVDTGLPKYQSGDLNILLR